MASSKGPRPTAPPRGPALVRPAIGALLLTLSGAACGDDSGTSETGNATDPPPMPNDGPMPDTGNSTDIPPMPDEEGPMPDPTLTASGTSTGTGTGTGTGTDATGSSTAADTEIAPMIPPGTSSSG